VKVIFIKDEISGGYQPPAGIDPAKRFFDDVSCTNR